MNVCTAATLFSTSFTFSYKFSGIKIVMYVTMTITARKTRTMIDEGDELLIGTKLGKQDKCGQDAFDKEHTKTEEDERILDLAENTGAFPSIGFLILPSVQRNHSLLARSLRSDGKKYQTHHTITIPHLMHSLRASRPRQHDILASTIVAC